MTFRYRKSISLGRGIRLNLSKTGLGLSAGIPGMRYSVHSSGRRTRTIGVPGTGVYFRKDTRSAATGSGGASPTRRPSSAAMQAPALPHAGLFAPKDEKEFVAGVAAYLQGRHADALAHLTASMERDPHNQHVAEEYFSAFSLIALGRIPEAISMLERVVASHVELPDRLMTRYGTGGSVQVGITPSVVAEVPSSNLTAALILAELYQHEGAPEKATDLLESLGSVAPDPFFALSLADLYSEMGRDDDVLRVGEGWTRNVDDATCQLLVFKAAALQRKGLNDAALEVAREALRSRKRSPDILRHARYVRGIAYDATGKRARARQEWERIYADDPGFADVAARLGQRPLAGPPAPARPDEGP